MNPGGSVGFMRMESASRWRSPEPSTSAPKVVVLDRGQQIGASDKEKLPREELLKLMVGCAEFDKLSHELEEYAAEVEKRGLAANQSDSPTT